MSLSTSSSSSDMFFDVQQKTDKQHILDNPDTYIGSVESVDSQMWIMNDDSSKIIEKTIQYVPGLFKLFDESIVNCRDHVVRMSTKIASNVENALPVSHIDVSIQPDGTITMINDGNGIDVVQMDGHWVPELVFAHLRTSTNYNKNEEKIVGGKNGFGFKLVLIWSTYGRIETVDHIRGLKYIQEYSQNLDVIGPPSITKCKTKPYTKITFKPDYVRLGMPDGLSQDMIALLKKRVYDISAVTDKSIKVKYNDVLIPTKNFEQYISLYIGEKTASPRVYESGGDRWEYAVALSPTHEFAQVSFVNGINTYKGGKHVDYIMGQIVRKLGDYIEKKKKVRVNATSIKEQLILFLRCDIVNPAFDSQTKDFLNTPSNKFGSKCDVSDKFIEKVAKMGVMDNACAITEVKENKAAKKTDGTKSRSVRGIPKLTDANWAGTDKSSQCVLILCEGDSAKSGIISGLSSEDRNTIGVYPLRGKLLNVRGEQVRKINENKEIVEIKQILGLVSGKQYTSIEDINTNLRYGKVIFLTDQDLDGSHIKGLCINLFSCEWPSLTQIPGFIGFMNTPILKAQKGKTELKFYNNGEFEMWKAQNEQQLHLWKIKYYKGLGTSTAKEFKEYFEEKKLVDFEYTDGASNDALDMVFNKKRADDRKGWLKKYDRNAYLNTSNPRVLYEEFVDKEFIHFSKYDCDRSIPNLMDGLKISQRKILYSAFKRNLTTEIKVAQFTGYVSEHSGYHHGEASLNAAIVGMAQNYVGSNNINVLYPSGQFGTRLMGGKDSASERYIFTRLEQITRQIFSKHDDEILTYLEDDGTPVEPTYYAPIIPMVLVNGCKGIGTAFSTDIMCYNPLEIIEYIQDKLTNIRIVNEDTDNDTPAFVPYYEGFKGTITRVEPSSNVRYLIRGTYEVMGEDKIRVTELPVGYWTQDFKELLEELSGPIENKDGTKTPAIIKGPCQDNSTDCTVDVIITFVKGKLNELLNSKGEYGCNGLEKLLKLYTTNTTTNMHLFDEHEHLQKYNSVEEIIDAYYDVRLSLYDARKKRMVEILEKELVLLSNRAKYIAENLNGTIDMRRKKREEVIAILKGKGYDMIFKQTEESNDDCYNYLIKMPMDSVTEEMVIKLNREHGEKQQELETIKNTTTNRMWLNDLNALKSYYVTTYKKERETIVQPVLESKTNKVKKHVVGTGKPIKKAKTVVA